MPGIVYTLGIQPSGNKNKVPALESLHLSERKTNHEQQTTVLFAFWVLYNHILSMMGEHTYKINSVV